MVFPNEAGLSAPPVSPARAIISWVWFMEKLRHNRVMARIMRYEVNCRDYTADCFCLSLSTEKKGGMQTILR